MNFCVNFVLVISTGAKRNGEIYGQHKLKRLKGVDSSTSLGMTTNYYSYEEITIIRFNHCFGSNFDLLHEQKS